MFYSDKPISSKKDDLLKRHGFAKLLARSLINLNSADTFTVGLYGKWGSGKTSLVNMMLQEIENCQNETKAYIIVHFEPWNFSNTDQLLTQFFIRLSNEFRSKDDKNLAKIGEALEKYSDAFQITEAIPVVGGLLALLGKNGVSALGKKMKKGSDEKDILRQKEYVISLLDRHPNKILIVIDDIDRLSNEQICQVFQLITSVAKFPNTTYLLVFDKEIVVKALEKVQEGSGENYLEKIIQMPIQIPDIQKSELRQALFNRLDKIISEHEDIFFSAAHWQKMFEPCIDPFVQNLRDINRLCNAVEFKLTTIASEVDFTDMVAISALEIYFPSVYGWVKTNKAVLTGDNDFSSIGSIKKGQKEWYEFYQEQILLIFQNEKAVGIKNAHVTTAITFLSQLFPYFGRKIGKIFDIYDLEQFRKHNQIAHPEKFDRYFHLNLDYIGLKKVDILDAVQLLDCESFTTFLLKQDQDGTSYEFLAEVKAMMSEISSNRAKVIAEALFEVSSQLDTTSKSFLSLNASLYAENIIPDLIDRLPSTERIDFIYGVIKSASLNSLQVCASIINMLELGYGRLAANGTERNFKKIITLEELIELETVFCHKVKEILRSTSLFDFNNWRIVYYLLECFDPDFAKAYLKDSLENNQNILKYLDNSVTAWTGSGTEYEITDEYLKFLTKERVLEAIQTQAKEGALFTLPARIQNKCGAFFLNAVGKQRYTGHVSQEDVNDLLASWQEQKNHMN